MQRKCDNTKDQFLHLFFTFVFGLCFSREGKLPVLSSENILLRAKNHIVGGDRFRGAGEGAHPHQLDEFNLI